MRAASRFAIIGVMGGLTAACSTDRFANASLSNPFSSGPSKQQRPSDPVRTGSINPDTSDEPMPPRGSMQSRPIAPIQSSPIPAPTYSAPSAGMPTRPRTASGSAGWSTTGGTTVIVGPGETLTTLTSRYGVPGEAILSANGLKPGDVTAGRRVVIPVYSARQDAEPAPARRVEAAPVRYNTPPAPAPARVVASQKLDVKKEPPRTLAEAAPPKSKLRPGQTVAKAPEPVRPPARVAEVKQPAPVAAPKVVAKVEPKPARVEPAKVAKVEPKPAKIEPVKVAKAAPRPAKVEPAKVAKVEQKPAKAEPAREVVLPAKKVDAKVARSEAPKAAEAPQKVASVATAKPEPAKAPVREPDTTASIAPAAPVASSGGSSSGDFRWPARGRVISSFGGGGGNEGINIAVPEGTAVKAAGDGVVAYAGSEVKGYGNLVLIRHDNGYVSAYANNGQIDVKRGQRVNRGQSIAKSGQTGNVTSPQLHFEIRKGSTPVDPMKYLASAE